MIAYADVSPDFARREHLMTWRIGDHIDNRFEVCRVMQGGMGIVYIAFDHELKIAVALKTFRDDLLASRPEISERFKREALSWIALEEHENVTRAITAAELGLKPFLILEFVTGGTLRQWIGTPRLLSNPTQIVRFAIQFCDGMTHAATKGIQVHRDIKPENCLITDQNVLKVSDFGLAKALDSSIDEKRLELSGKPLGSMKSTRELSEATTVDLAVSSGNDSRTNIFWKLWKKRNKADQLVTLNIGNAAAATTRAAALSVKGGAQGTPHYMAPEQFAGSPTLDVRADIYAFGVMLFEMISGKRPFTGQTLDELLRKHEAEQPPFLGCDKRLEDLVQSCLAKEPDHRPESFRSIRDSLDAVYSSLTGHPAPMPVRGRDLSAVGLTNKSIGLITFGKYREALDCSERAIELNADSSNAWTIKGLALLRLRPVDGITEALACHERALELNPAHAAANSNMGDCLLELRRFDEAIAAFDKGVELNANNFQAWLMKAEGLRQCKRLDEALRCCDQALHLNPTSAKAWTNKGVILSELKRIDDAIKCMDRAIELENDDKAWYGKAVELARINRLDDALHCYDKTLELNSRFEQAWANKSNVLRRLGRTKEAMDCCVRALELDPSDLVAWGIKTSLFSDAGRFEEAIESLQRSLALNPLNDAAWTQHGFLLNLLSKHESALDSLNKAVEINPQNANAWFCRSKTLTVLHRLAEASESIGHALAVQPAEPEICREKIMVQRYIDDSASGATSEDLKDAIVARRQARFILRASRQLTLAAGAALRKAVDENSSLIADFQKRRSEFLKIDEMMLFFFEVAFVSWFNQAKHGWTDNMKKLIRDLTIEELPWQLRLLPVDPNRKAAPQFDVEALQTNLRSVIESVDSAMRRIFSMEDKEKREKTTFEMFVVYFARILPAAATLFGKGQNSPELLAFTKLSQPFTKGCWEGAVNAENLVKNTF
jgi:tetratricopeptide (TPR) repeat protein